MANYFENAISFGVFDADSGAYLGGGDFGNLPTVPNVLPALPGTFAPSQTTAGPRVVSTGSGAAAGPIGLGTFAPANAQGAPVNASSAAPSSDTGGSGSIGDYFLRFVIVILGFIFVAVGLHQLAPSAVPDIRSAVR